MQEIVVGFRTPSGELRTTQTFKTIEIPRLVRGKAGAWDPMICLEWGKRFLGFIRDIVTTPEENDTAENEGKADDGEQARGEGTRANVEPGFKVSAEDFKSCGDETTQIEANAESGLETGKECGPGPDLKSKAKAKVWRVRFTPRTGVSVSILDEEGVKEVEAGQEDRVGFLPRWYWDAIEGSVPGLGFR